MTDRICPFMSHRGGQEIVLCYREDCVAWKAHPTRSESSPGGYCVRIWGPD